MVVYENVWNGRKEGCQDPLSIYILNYSNELNRLIIKL